MSESWFKEELYGHWRQSFLITERIFQSEGGLQDIAVFETPVFGRVLTLDGVIQLTTGDEFVYHEMLAHVPIYAHGAVENVCIVGGGDGGMLRQVLKHSSVKSAVLVEIDAQVVEFCRTHLPMVSDGAFDDPRTRIVIADGIDYMRGTRDRFDVIVIDSTDPSGPGEALFTEAFYKDCAAVLKPGGIVVNQNGVPFLQGREIPDTYNRRKPHFADVGFFVAAVPTYVGGFMALGWASDDPAYRGLSRDVIAARFAAAPVKTRYYTPDLHAASFCLPAYVQALIPQ